MTAPLRLALGLGFLFVSALSSAGCDNPSPSKTSQQQATAPDLAAQSAEKQDSAQSSDDAEFVEETLPNGVKFFRKKGDVPPESTPLATAQDLTITLADWDDALRQSVLSAPDRVLKDHEVKIPLSQRVIPHFQKSVIMSLVQKEVVERELAKRNIEISPQEIEAFIAEVPLLKRFTQDPVTDVEGNPTSHTLASLNISREDLDQAARFEVAKTKLADAILTEVGDDELWEAYQTEKNTIKLLLAYVSNVPSPTELDDFMALDKAKAERGKSSEIDAYYQAHPRKYMTPRQVQLTILRPGPGATPDSQQLAKVAKALQAGKDPQALADSYQYELETDQRYHRQENRRAFRAEVGETGFEGGGPRGMYVWRVEGFVESELRPLDRGLRREIASEILRQNIVKAAKDEIQPALRILQDIEKGPDGKPTKESVDKALTELNTTDVRSLLSSSFVPDRNVAIPGIGLAEEVVEAAAKLSLKKQLPSDPVLSRGRVFTFRLVDRHKPTRKEFEADKASFRKDYNNRLRPLVIDRFLSDWVKEAELEVNPEPLHIKYGLLKRDS